MTVVTARGSSQLTSGDQFTYNALPAPAISSLSPATGTTAGGTTITLTGTRFTGASSVLVDNAPVPFNVQSDTSIVVVSPSHIAGAVAFRVLTPTGVSLLSSNDLFSYSAASAPTLTGVSPSSGATPPPPRSPAWA